MISATRDDWLLKVPQLVAGEILTIHPRNNLTSAEVYDAMRAQGHKRGFVIEQHGSKIWIQRVKSD